MATRSKSYVYLTHIALWALLFCIPLFPYYPEDGEELFLTIIYSQLVLLVGIFYFNSNYLVPRYLFRRKILNYTFLCILLVFIIVATQTLLSQHIGLEEYLNNRHEMGMGEDPEPRRAVFPVVTTILTIFISTTVTVVKRLLNREQEHQLAQQEKVKAELAFLRNQVNPHFFFNTLNTIYALVDDTNNKARESVHKLSKLMRYLLYETEKEKVPLQKEIAFIKDFIDLNRMRLPSDVEIDLQTDIRNPMTPISPLQFISFIENAFKHGVSYQEKSFIHLSIVQKEQSLEFVVRNSNWPKRPLLGSGGLGLNNARKRLDLLHGDGNYDLFIENKDATFEVVLIIPLHED